MFLIRYNNAYVTGFDSKSQLVTITFNKPNALTFDSKNVAKKFILNRINTVRNSLTIQAAK